MSDRCKSLVSFFLAHPKIGLPSNGLYLLIALNEMSTVVGISCPEYSLIFINRKGLGSWFKSRYLFLVSIELIVNDMLDWGDLWKQGFRFRPLWGEEFRVINQPCCWLGGACQEATRVVHSRGWSIWVTKTAEEGNLRAAWQGHNTTVIDKVVDLIQISFESYVMPEFKFVIHSLLPVQSLIVHLRRLRLSGVVLCQTINNR